MATVRRQGARRLGVIVFIVLAAGVATAIVRSSSDNGTHVHTAQSPTTNIDETTTTVGATEGSGLAPDTTAGSAAEGGAASTPSSTETTSGAGSGLAASGSGAAAATDEQPNTGGPLPFLPGLVLLVCAVLLRRRATAVAVIVER